MYRRSSLHLPPTFSCQCSHSSCPSKMQEAHDYLDECTEESRSLRVQLLRLFLRARECTPERLEQAGPGHPHVSNRHIHRPPRLRPVPKCRSCVVIHRRSPPEETARIARSARVEGQHTESALDAGDGEVKETSHLDHVQIGPALYACPGAASARRATISDRCSDKPRMRTSSAHRHLARSIDEAERLAAS